MKRFLFATAVCTLITFASAGAQQRTLIGGEDSPANGWFVAPATKITRVNAEDVTLGGLRVGWIINHNFSIGFAGYGMGDNDGVPAAAREYYKNPDGTYRDLELIYGYGGVEAEYTGRWDSLVNYSVGAIMGAGNVEYAENDIDDGFNHHDSFFVFEPGVNVELNVIRWMKAGVGASYRVATGVDTIGLDNHDVSGFSGTITFKFGRF